MRYLVYIFTCLMILLSAHTQAQENEKQVFKLYGKVFHKESQVKGVTIEVFIEDSLVYTDQSNVFGKFNIKLTEGYEYQINFTKEKFITKTVIVQSFALDGDKLSPFAFDLDLVKERDFRYVDIPNDLGRVAELYFDEEIKALSWDRRYTQEAHNEIKNFQELNKAKRYEKYSRF